MWLWLWRGATDKNHSTSHSLTYHGHVDTYVCMQLRRRLHVCVVPLLRKYTPLLIPTGIVCMYTCILCSTVVERTNENKQIDKRRPFPPIPSLHWFSCSTHPPTHTHWGVRQGFAHHTHSLTHEANTPHADQKRQKSPQPPGQPSALLPFTSPPHRRCQRRRRPHRRRA